MSDIRDDTPWEGVDLDGSLAEYSERYGISVVGPPIRPMLARVKAWMAQGRRVKIVTARAAIPEQVLLVQAWLAAQGIGGLEITDRKDFGMLRLWDDRAVQLIPNTGIPIEDVLRDTCLGHGKPRAGKG